MNLLALSAESTEDIQFRVALSLLHGHPRGDESSITALVAWIRRACSTSHDADDLTQGFLAELIARPALVDNILAASPGRLRAYLRRSLRQWRHNHGVDDHVRALRKAIDTVVRNNPHFSCAGGRVALRADSIATLRPGHIWDEHGRIIHAALIAAVTWLLQNEGPANRTALARRLHQDYAAPPHGSDAQASETPRDSKTLAAARLDLRRTLAAELQRDDASRDLIAIIVEQAATTDLAKQMGTHPRTLQRNAHALRARLAHALSDAAPMRTLRAKPRGVEGPERLAAQPAAGR